MNTLDMTMCARRAEELATLFRHIERTRMVGVPMLNRALHVEAIGFEPLDRPTSAPPAATAWAASRTELAGPIGIRPSTSVPAPEHCAATSTPHAEPDAFGILLTPWFMNLVLLPLCRVDAVPPTDTRQTRRIGKTRFEFIAAHEPAIGAFDICSLFSPVFEFADQACAVATARAVLTALRAPAAAPQPAECTAPHRPTANAGAPPARRAFFHVLAGGRKATEA